jgi:DNA-binding transcriptional regulator PaaX
MSSKSAAGRGAVELLYLIAGKKSPYIHASYSRAQVTRKLWDMRRAGHIVSKNTNHYISKRGQKLLTEDKIWALTIKKPKLWDGKWHMVLFDIPVKKSKQRNAFRAKLKELGLELYQHSIWVHPYPLEETVRAISEFYQISDCVLFAVAEKINGEKKLRQKFKIS